MQNLKQSLDLDEYIWLVEYPRIIQSLSHNIYRETNHLCPPVFQNRLFEAWVFYISQN